MFRTCFLNPFSRISSDKNWVVIDRLNSNILPTETEVVLETSKVLVCLPSLPESSEDPTRFLWRKLIHESAATRIEIVSAVLEHFREISWLSLSDDYGDTSESESKSVSFLRKKTIRFCGNTHKNFSILLKYEHRSNVLAKRKLRWVDYLYKKFVARMGGNNRCK